MLFTESGPGRRRGVKVRKHAPPRRSAPLGRVVTQRR